MLDIRAFHDLPRTQDGRYIEPITFPLTYPPISCSFSFLQKVYQRCLMWFGLSRYKKNPHHRRPNGWLKLFKRSKISDKCIENDMTLLKLEDSQVYQLRHSSLYFFSNTPQSCSFYSKGLRTLKHIDCLSLWTQKTC
jgi:hypothetical protein